MRTRTPGRGRTWTERGPVVVLALLAYVPALLTRPGWISADTKTYLFLDPGALLSRAPYMWDPNVATGTVTHQNIGYLFPLGPYFWLIDHVPIPMWVGQRLWVGTTLFAAGLGFWWLARRLSMTGWAVLAGALVYMLSPYSLAYLGRTTVILMPWAALPWLIGLARRSLYEGTWRAPAWFALVVTVVGGINASSLLFIGLAPALWFPYAVWVTKEADLRSALRTMLRIAALLVPTQLWWVAGLSVQASYGLPILELTETVKTVAETSTPAEIARQLGYWYFYGRDGLESWTEAAHFYTQNLFFIVLSFALPALTMLAGFTVRWRYRAYAVGLVLLGLVIGVGAHPYDDPPPLGAAVKAAADVSAAGMALRNSPRAVPLLVLGGALIVTAWLSALGPALATWRDGRFGRWAGVVTAAVAVIAVVNLPTLWTGGVVQTNLEYPDELPDYWQQAVAAIDQGDPATRVMEFPGMDFGTYRWGNTQDVITPGLIDRPWVGRQLIPYGSPAAADLIRAFDRRFQEGIIEPDAIGPVAALVGAGDALLRSDTQYERYGTARPRAVWERLDRPLAGLGEPETFGEPVRNQAVPEQPMLDETELGLDPDHREPWPLALYEVLDPRSEVRTSGGVAAVIAGDGDGVVDLAAEGLMPEGMFVYAATFADDPEAIEQMASSGARLILTDTNRRRAQRWGTLRENNGFTEQAGETELVPDPSGTRLVVFPHADDDSFTVADLRGVESVRASTYGNPVAYTPEDRAANALDGDVTTAWKVGAFDEVRGERIEVVLDEPAASSTLNLVQPFFGANRWITEIDVRVDGRDLGRFDLTDASLTLEGQDLDIGADGWTTLEIEVADANIHRRNSYKGFSGVGFSEIGIPGVTMDEVIVLPRDLLPAAGSAEADAPLDVVLTRIRANPSEPFRRDPERGMAREFELPTPRELTLTGTARLSSAAPGEVLDELLGRGRDVTGLEVRTSDFLAGDIEARGSSALDGDPSTAWSTGYTGQIGRFIEVESDEPVTVDQLDLQIVADGRHTVPTRLAVAVDDEVVEVDLPEIADGTEENHVVPVTVPLPEPLTGSTVRVTVVGARDQLTVDFFNPEPIIMPIGIAELGIDGLDVPALPERIDLGCRDDLLTVDGEPVAVRVSGETVDAVDRLALDVETCADEPLSLDGTVLVRTAKGRDTGVDLDRLVLSTGPPTPATAPSGPSVDVVGSTRLGRDIHVEGIDGPFWLVLGQSESDGWSAQADGIGDLGPSILVDAHANGWYVEVPDGVDSLDITLRWTPQRRVWISLVVSVLGVIGCIVLVVLGRRPGSEPPVDAPLLDDPTRSGGGRPNARGLAVPVLLAGLLAFSVGGPWIGVLVALATAVAVWWDRGRLALSLPAVLIIPPVGVYVAGRQFGYEYPAGVEWPTAFDPAKWFVLIALLLLAVDVVVTSVRRRRSDGPEGPAS